MELTENFLGKLNDLPTLPTIYSAVCDVVANPQSTIEDMAQIVLVDQASAMKVLRVVNSAFYGMNMRIETVSRAIMFLGFNEVCNLILASSVISLFSRKKVLQRFPPSDFWAHSIAVGMASRMIGQAAGAVMLEHYFVGGILHDIGKLLLLEVSRDAFSKALNLSFEEGLSIRDAEREVLGVDHAEVGGKLAEYWGIPPPIVNVIAHHHTGVVGDKPDILVASVNLGDYIARSLELGFPGDNLVPQPNPDLWDRLNLRPGLFRNTIPAMLDSYRETVGLMLAP